MYEVIFQYGPLTLTTFNTLLAIAFVVGAIFLIRFIQLKKMKLSFFVNNFAYIVLMPLLSGRILNVIEHFPAYRTDLLQIFTVWDMKFSGFGIFYGAVITLYLLARREHEDFWSWFDAFVLCGLVGLIFIHLGDFFSGNFYGRPTGLPWGIAFDTYDIPFTTPIHPVQLYSALATFIIFVNFMRSAKRTHLTGLTGNLSVMLYCIASFGIDFLHGAPSMYAKITYAVIAAFAFIFYMNCSHKKLFE